MHQLLHLLNKPTITVIGVMSGTSLDGIDLAFTEFTGIDEHPAFSVKATHYFEMPGTLRTNIQQCFTGNTEQVCRLNKEIGEFISLCVQTFISETGERPDLIASHGQTIYHISGHSTLQIGDSDYIAKTSGIPTVYDFRSADMVFGGTGAPLVPVFDRLLNYPHQTSTIFQNLGGIGNLTYIPSDAPENLFAFDTGPANILSDCMMRIHTNGKIGFDENAKLAKKGMINNDLLHVLKSHPYLKKEPPKSTGHEEFGMNYVKEVMEKFKQIPIEDKLRTANRAVAEVTVSTYHRYCPNFDRVFLTGGGAKNPVLYGDFVELLGKNKLQVFTDTYGFDPNFKEAIAFAYLGYCRCRNIPSNVPQITHATAAVCLGKLAFPYRLAGKNKNT